MWPRSSLSISSPFSSPLATEWDSHGTHVWTHPEDPLVIAAGAPDLDLRISLQDASGRDLMWTPEAIDFYSCVVARVTRADGTAITASISLEPDRTTIAEAAICREGCMCHGARESPLAGWMLLFALLLLRRRRD